MIEFSHVDRLQPLDLILIHFVNLPGWSSCKGNGSGHVPFCGPLALDGSGWTNAHHGNLDAFQGENTSTWFATRNRRDEIVKRYQGATDTRRLVKTPSSEPGSKMRRTKAPRKAKSKSAFEFREREHMPTPNPYKPMTSGLDSLCSQQIEVPCVEEL